MKIVKITYKELQKWKAARYDNQVIKNILAKYLNVKPSEIGDYDQVNYGLTFEVWLVVDFCPRCENEVPIDDTYCPFCGQALKRSEQ